MRRVIFISSLLFLPFIGCSRDNTVEPFDYDRDTPVWLKAKIDSISENPAYFGARVFRYEWRQEVLYHIEVPISSCAYCELYDENGTKKQFTDDEDFQDFLANKENEILIWEWKS
jgi:hypothetical protein